MLLKIIQNRLIETRRQEIAEDAKQVITAFDKGELNPQTADQIIEELQKTLQDD